MYYDYDAKKQRVDRVVENDDGTTKNLTIYVDYTEVSKSTNSPFYSSDKWKFSTLIFWPFLKIKLHFLVC